MVSFHSQSPLAHQESFEFPSPARLPESNARSEPWSVQDCVDAARKRRRLCSPTHQVHPIHHTHEESRIRIPRGVVQEGNHIIPTHQHPAVSQCLAHIRKTLSLPPRTPETILALCSIEVFLHPSDPAHWLFWSNERKADTVEVLGRICDASPPLIQPSRTWSDSMLYSLPQLHCQAWHDILRDEPWYPTLVATEPSSRGPTLRKRKTVTETPSSTSTISPLPETADDVPAPAAKRMRISRSQPRPVTELSPEAKPVTCISGSVAPLSVRPSSRRNSARPIRRPAKFRDAEWTDSGSSRSSSCSPSAAIALLPPGESGLVGETQTDSRRGSSSSARTLIGSESGSRGSSPMSDLTTITLVDTESVCAKARVRKSGNKGVASVRMMTRARTRIRASN